MIPLLFLLGFTLFAWPVAALRAHTYRKGDSVKLYVNKLTSLQQLFPLSPYHVPLCRPESVKGARQNLGQHLTGDEIRTSPYSSGDENILQFGRDMRCEHLCLSHMGHSETPGNAKKTPNRMVEAIHKGYHQNWLLDELPAAYKSENEAWITTRYAGGFPLGYVGDNGMAYLYNHLNLEIEYHPVHEHDGDDEELQNMNDHDEYRIVRFTVQPLSIRHKFQKWTKDEIKAGANRDPDSHLPQLARLTHPPPSCGPRKAKYNHTTWLQLQTSKISPQPASHHVLFTFDVVWVPNMKLHWSDRWDVYLSADGMKNTENHWFSTIVSLVLLTLLSSMIVTLLSNNLQRDFKRYNKVATDEEKEEALEEYGWKLVHGDVWRAPDRPLELAVLLGTGAQLLTTSVICLSLGMLGIIQPMHRGKMVIAQLVMFSLAGSVNGYVTGYFYRMWGGATWRPAGLAAALGYSGLAFGVFFIASSMANALESTMRVSFGALVAILVMWLCLCAPLTYLATWVGFYRPQLEFPTRVSPTPRPIPEAPWYTSAPLNLVMAGIFPFVPCFFEVYDTLCVLWLDAYNPFYAFFFFIGVCALLLAAELTVLLTYFQLVREDYHWWWRSFGTGGAAALYIFGYVVYYHAQHLQAANHVPSWFLYYGYMSVACVGLACAAGFVGFMASLSFTRAIFASVKID